MAWAISLPIEEANPERNSIGLVARCLTRHCVLEAEKERRTELANFLRTRRAKITPEALGLPKRGRRRTPGLRREEVAELIGVGVTGRSETKRGRPEERGESHSYYISRSRRLKCSGAPCGYQGGDGAELVPG